METVKVAVRIRPLSQKEADEGAQMCCYIPAEDPCQISLGDRSFTFDTVLPPDCGQLDVYASCCAPLLKSFLEGFNCTVFAYGQTGAGKTFSVEGIIEHFVPSLFDTLAALRGEIEETSTSENETPSPQPSEPSIDFTIRVSAMEIHNDAIKDLIPAATSDFRPSDALMHSAEGISLNESEAEMHTDHSGQPRKASEKSLSIREGANGHVIIAGLSEKPVSTVNDVFQVIGESLSTRTVAGTQMNEESSRSHAVITIMLDQRREVSPDPTSPVFETITSKFRIVDLAGSERQKKTGATGMRLKESIHINSGLLSLGNVISCLCEQEEFPNRRIHVPYRDSKLTRVLQDSLGGNSVTVMLACVSPADTNFEETLNTLKYANRAKNIRNKPIKNTDPQIALIQSLQKELLAAKALLAQHGIPFSGETPTGSGQRRTTPRDGPSPRHGISLTRPNPDADILQKCTRLFDEIAPRMPAEMQSVFIGQRKSLNFLEKLNAFIRWSAETSTRASDMERYIYQLESQYNETLRPSEEKAGPSENERLSDSETRTSQGAEGTKPSIEISNIDIDKVTEERNEIVNERIDLTARRRALQMERDKFERQQSVHGQTLASMEAEIKSREKIIHELIIREYEAEQILEEYTENIHEVEAERNRAQIDLAKALKALDSRQLSKENLAKEARRLQTQADTRIRQLEHAISDLRRKQADAEGAMRQHRVENAQLRKLSGELSRLRENHEAAKAQVRETNMRNVQIKKESSAREKFLLKKMEKIEHLNMQLSRCLDKKEAEIKRMRMTRQRNFQKNHPSQRGLQGPLETKVDYEESAEESRKSHSKYGIDTSLDVHALQAKRLIEEQKLRDLRVEREDALLLRQEHADALMHFQSETKEKLKKALIGWNRRITELAQTAEKVSSEGGEPEEIARLHEEKAKAEQAHTKVLHFAQTQEQELFEKIRKADDAIDSLDASIAFHNNRHSIFSLHVKRGMDGGN